MINEVHPLPPDVIDSTATTVMSAPSVSRVALPASRAVYRPELDMLRFFSFLGVFAVHTLAYPAAYLVERHVPIRVVQSVLPFVYGGAFGVDLFFVLSAYLITDLLLREKEEFGRINIKSFYMRRVLRIWPLYYAFIAAVILFSGLDSGQKFPNHFLIPFLLFVGNWSFVLIGWPNSVLVPLWSVSVEEQFYLFWPPIVARLTRERIVTAAWIMVAIANTVRIYEIGMTHSSADQLWANTFAHLDSLAAGILIAALLGGGVPNLRSGLRLVLAIGGILLIGLRGHFVTDMKDPQNLGAALGYPVVVIGCCMLLFAFLGLRVRIPIVSYLGKISYGLYVYHLMAVRLADKILPEYHGGIFVAGRLVVGLALTIAISALSYVVLEKPFLKLKQRFTLVQSRPA
jgi:peptidoglycan/LPS O-acetylase OafA/YrhL